MRFGIFQFESHKNADFEQKMMSLEERVDRDREFTHITLFPQQTGFYENEFYQNNQAQIAQKPFNIPGTFDA